MNKQILFIHGGGKDGHKTDEELVISLKTTLGNKYQIHYTEIQVDENVSDFGWLTAIGAGLSKLNGAVILIRHSFGASIILKYLSENAVNKKIEGIFLIASPFWSGNEEWVKGLKLKNDFSAKLPSDIPFHFYHCKDDEEISFDDFQLYKQKIPQATFHKIPSGRQAVR